VPIKQTTTDITNSLGVLNVSDEDEYDYADADRPDDQIDSLDGSSAAVGTHAGSSTYREQSKTKRDPAFTAGDRRIDVVVPDTVESSQLGLGKHDTAMNRNFTESTPSGSDTTLTFSVNFRSIVKVRISAYITWPAKPEAQETCEDGGSRDRQGATVVGYRLRYWRSGGGSYGGLADEAQLTVSLMENVVLLEDLEPNSRYRYQLKYITRDRGGGGGREVVPLGDQRGSVARETQETEWSRVEEILTGPPS